MNFINFLKGKRRRRIVFFNGNCWGNAFYVTFPKIIEVGKKCFGYGFYHYPIDKNILICQVFKDTVAVFEIKKVEYYLDPQDMFHWEGKRLPYKKLSNLESDEIKRRYDIEQRNNI